MGLPLSGSKKVQSEVANMRLIIDILNTFCSLSKMSKVMSYLANKFKLYIPKTY